MLSFFDNLQWDTAFWMPGIKAYILSFYFRRSIFQGFTAEIWKMVCDPAFIAVHKNPDGKYKQMSYEKKPNCTSEFIRKCETFTR